MTALPQAVLCAPAGSDRPSLVLHTGGDQPDPDAALADRVRAGDTSALGVLFERYYEPLVRFAAVYLHATEPAREVVSEVFLNIWRRRAEWTPSVVQTYLYGAVRNRVHGAIRDRQADDRKMQAVASEIAGVAMAGPPRAADEYLESLDLADRVWRCVDELADGPRAVLMLRWRDHLEFEEIALALGTTVGAAYTQHSRAMKLLRERLGDVLR